MILYILQQFLFSFSIQDMNQHLNKGLKCFNLLLTFKSYRPEDNIEYKGKINLKILIKHEILKLIKEKSQGWKAYSC